MVPGMATHDYNPNTWKAEMGIVSLRPAWAAYQGSVSKRVEARGRTEAEKKTKDDTLRKG